MQNVAITCARNEADIIEAFVRHTLTYCQKLIVLDHGSTDATPEILRSLREEGLALHVVRDESLGRMQESQMNRLLQMAVSEFAADWIWCLDADEFITGSMDSLFPTPVHENTPCLKIPLRTYYSHKDDPADILNPVCRITHRLEREPKGDDPSDPSLHKVFIPGPLAKRTAATIAPGNHLFFVEGAEAPSVIAKDAWLAHFSLRSAQQYGIKLAAKRLNALRYISPKGDEGTFYENAYARMRDNYSAFEENFHHEHLAYLPSHDPCAVIPDPIHYAGGALRYTPQMGNSNQLTCQILRLAEALARPCAGSARPAAEQPDEKSGVLAVEAFAPCAKGLHRAQTVETASPGKHVLEFLLTPSATKTDVHLRFHGEPGMLEISAITLLHPDGKETTYRGDDLRKRLSVIANAASIHSENVYRLLISREPVIVVFRNCKKEGIPFPKSLRIELRHERELQKPVVLHPAVLNEMNRNAAAHELLEKKLTLLQGQLKYTIGETIDFSDRGNALLFMEKGWAAPEPWGTWTEGPEAVLKIRFEKSPPQDVRLNVVAKGLLGPLHPKLHTSVTMNGEPLEEWELGNDQFAKFTFIIPAGKIRARECELAFKIADPRTPEALGIAGDKRLLGMGFQRIDFQCAQGWQSLAGFFKK